jgi:agmatine/peptidylarginine deiminase
VEKILNVRFPAEWAKQSAVMLTWPHIHTDWKDNLEEVTACFVAIAKEIVKHEKLLIVCNNSDEVKKTLKGIDYSQILFREIKTNDTWARDHGPIIVWMNDIPYILDFTFNGWGLKFPANYDNQITRQLYESHVFSPKVVYQNMQYVVLEGGSIESDGEGILLTTKRCLLSENRNGYKSLAEITDFFQLIFGVKRILCLEHGYLAGDDTDSHIDTLARFCDEHTIAYVQCTDKEDEHFNELSLMEAEIRKFRTAEGKPYRLIPLPMAKPVYHEGERLPATYANFLIINETVLLPFYDSDLDALAQKALQEAFPDREIVGVNCLPLIKQHGSLHCVSMQLPAHCLSD